MFLKIKPASEVLSEAGFTLFIRFMLISLSEHLVAVGIENTHRCIHDQKIHHRNIADKSVFWC